MVALNATPVAYPGSPLHLNVEFCANPPAHAARWLHGDRVFTPGNQYGSTVLAYSVKVVPLVYSFKMYLMIFFFFLGSSYALLQGGSSDLCQHA